MLSLHLSPYANISQDIYIYIYLAEGTVVNYENLGIDERSVGGWKTGDGWG